MGGTWVGGAVDLEPDCGTVSFIEAAMARASASSSD